MTVTLILHNVTSELYDITVTCTIHPESEADLCEVRAMDDGLVTRTGTCTFMYPVYTLHSYSYSKWLNDDCTIF